MKTPTVEKDAGAEILLWRVHVVDELLGDNRELQRVFYHYIRLKIFDDKGKEKASTIDLDYREPGGILDVAGRTIRPDGTILELDKKSVYKRDLVRAGQLRQKVVSFAMPGVEPGVIIEYRWRQTEDDNRFRYMRLRFQREFPIERVTYFVKPLSQNVSREQLYLLHFNCNPSPIEQEKDGYSSTSVENVPATHFEPFAPSTPNLEAWALLFYTQNGQRTPEKYWGEEGRKTYHDVRDLLKNSDELKSAGAEIASGAAGDDQKISALVNYLRLHVRSFDDPALTTAERQKFLESLPKGRRRNSAEVFRSGIALPNEMNLVFAQLAEQAGLETRPVLISNTSEHLFQPQMVERYFLDHEVTAVKVGGSWRVVDSSNRWITPGMLPSNEEGVYALVTDAKEPMFIQTPLSAPETSTERRTARLTLNSDGSLSGDVEETYTGHRGEDYRLETATKSSAQREEWWQERLKRMFPDANVADLKIENFEDLRKPLLVRYHLDAPRYAQLTGKRLFFQPSAFRRAQASPFSASERRFAVEFPYAWQESDELHIRLPQGYVLDNADSPTGLNFGDTGSLRFDLTVVSGKDPELVLKRDLTFGQKGFLFFPAQSYTSVKKAFDAVQVRDTHAISLKAN